MKRYGIIFREKDIPKIRGISTIECNCRPMIYAGKISPTNAIITYGAGWCIKNENTINPRQLSTASVIKVLLEKLSHLIISFSKQIQINDGFMEET